MNIYFHIDELHRDAVVASALKIKFANNGHTLTYGNRTSARLLKYFHSAFDVIIMPRPHIIYDNWKDDWLKWDTKFVTLSTESLGLICMDSHVMAKTLLEREYFEGKRNYVDAISAFCLWGSKQLQAIREYCPEVEKKCHVVGHPRQDKFCLPYRLEVCTSNSDGKKRVGIITRAVSINDYFGRSALCFFSTLLSEHFQFEYVNNATGEKLNSKRSSAQPAENTIVQSIDVASTIKLISALSSAGYNVVLRIHPKENFIEWQRLLINSGIQIEIVNSKEPFTHFLDSLDYLIGPPSTSFYEAIMSGVTPISISELDDRRKQFVGDLWEDNNCLMPYVFKPKSIKELLKYIDSNKRLIVDDEISKVLKQEADFPECISSLDKVVRICESVIDKPKKSSRFFNLLIFLRAQAMLGFLLKLKNKIKGSQDNSARFIMDKFTIRFINSLSVDK
jgi:surface carbohydrate biosynthesis protein